MRRTVRHRIYRVLWRLFRSPPMWLENRLYACECADARRDHMARGLP